MRITRRHATAGAAIGAGLAVVITAVALVPESQMVVSHGNRAQPAVRPSTRALTSSSPSSHRTTAARTQVSTPFVTTTRPVASTPRPKPSASVQKPADEGISWLPWGPADPG